MTDSECSTGIQRRLSMIQIVAELTTAATFAHFFTATFMRSTSGNDLFAPHQETRLYVPRTADQTCFVALAAASNLGAYDCQLTGFWVDVP
jgi:hypothetical protein